MTTKSKDNKKPAKGGAILEDVSKLVVPFSKAIKKDADAKKEKDSKDTVGGAKKTRKAKSTKGGSGKTSLMNEFDQLSADITKFLSKY
jgi:hypothetical protein